MQRYILYLILRNSLMYFLYSCFMLPFTLWTLQSEWYGHLKSSSLVPQLAPNSIYHALTHLKEKYNNPTIYITENGWASHRDSGLIDEDRITYLRAAWESALNALDAGVNLKGYMVWSLLDNMEWLEGYM